MRHSTQPWIGEKREIGGDRGERAEQCPWQAEKTRRRDDGQHQNNEVVAFDGIGNSHEQKSKQQLENHRGCAAPVRVQQRQMAFDELQDREAGQEQPLRCVVREIDQGAEHQGEQHVLNGEVEAGSRNRGG